MFSPVVANKQYTRPPKSSCHSERSRRVDFARHGLRLDYARRDGDVLEASLMIAHHDRGLFDGNGEIHLKMSNLAPILYLFNTLSLVSDYLS